MLISLNLKLDVIVLSEIWTYNIQFYSNLLPGYTLYYNLPANSNIGGIGVYVANNIMAIQTPEFKINKGDHRVENMWLQLVKNKKTYFQGAIYRHPNQSRAEFATKLEKTLSKINTRNHPSLLVGDITIDLLKSTTQKDTTSYVDMLISNNFLPITLFPTRITNRTAINC